MLLASAPNPLYLSPTPLKTSELVTRQKIERVWERWGQEQIRQKGEAGGLERWCGSDRGSGKITSTLPECMESCDAAGVLGVVALC